MTVEQLIRTWIDLEALHAALDEARIERGMSWRDVARDLEVAPSFFTRLRDGSQPDTLNVCLLCDWLGEDVRIEDFRAPLGERIQRPARPSDDDLFPDTSVAVRDAINARLTS